MFHIYTDEQYINNDDVIEQQYWHKATHAHEMAVISRKNKRGISGEQQVQSCYVLDLRASRSCVGLDSRAS